MKSTIPRQILTLLWALTAHTALSGISISFDSPSPCVYHGIHILREALQKEGFSVEFHGPLGNIDACDILVISNDSQLNTISDRLDIVPAEIRKEGYHLLVSDNHNTLVIAARDEVGAMYGLQTVADHVKNGHEFITVKSALENPCFQYRAIKFNLPWSPYRDYPATRLHLETCRDLHFWEAFLDMMAENRFNVLSLWNRHPFPYMIRAKNFPGATPLSDEELQDWKHFWKHLFRMAKDRGIQTFIVNWNIVVSPQFAETYGANPLGDTSELVEQYTRESVTQVINEYEDLTGIGISLADWMGQFKGKAAAKQREDWIRKTFVEGIRQANREVKFLHRSVLARSPLEMRNLLDNTGLEEPALVPVKFNWSHGHSTPNLIITHDYRTGKVDERFWNPKPESYHIEWMVRNEDFFILRWGQPDFIRSHIAANCQPFVNGYFVGSEGYIPALDYSHVTNSQKTWLYGFQKQWLFFKLWGRLLYSPNTPDSVFADAFDQRYGRGIGSKLLRAYSLASDMPLKLASFYRSTSDSTLYSEGFLAPLPSSRDCYFDDSSPFISVDELIDHDTLDPELISIKEYVKNVLGHNTVEDGIISPPELAAILESQGSRALELVNQLKCLPETNGSSVQSELKDIIVWSHLSIYFSRKLIGATALQMYRKTGHDVHKQKAVQYLEDALKSWQMVATHTRDRYKPVPHVALSRVSHYHRLFSWEYYLPQVQKDIDVALATATPDVDGSDSADTRD